MFSEKKKNDFKRSKTKGKVDSFHASWTIINVTQQFQELALKFRNDVNNTSA